MKWCSNELCGVGDLILANVFFQKCDNSILKELILEQNQGDNTDYNALMYCVNNKYEHADKYISLLFSILSQDEKKAYYNTKNKVCIMFIRNCTYTTYFNCCFLMYTVNKDGFTAYEMAENNSLHIEELQKLSL